jgi:carboxylesterase type B
MHFSGFFQSELGDAPYIMAHLRVGESTYRENIPFMIDTGHSHTSLSLKDLHEAGLNMKNLTKENSDAYTATDVVDLYSLKNAELVFVSAKGDQIEINFDRIFVTKSKNPKNEHVSYNAPSLLGRNAIYMFSLLVDKKKQKINLDFDENS